MPPIPDDSQELERYKATLRGREQYRRELFERIQLSDQAAVDIGLMAIRTAILINAGAVVALLAFVAQLGGNEKRQLADVLNASLPFVGGLISAAVAAGVAYFYQSFVSANAQRSLAEHSIGASDLKPHVWTPRLTTWSAVMMIFFIVVSLGLFTWGTLEVIDAMAPG